MRTSMAGAKARLAGWSRFARAIFPRSALASFFLVAAGLPFHDAQAANETYTYDTAGRLITVDHGDGKSTSYTLDRAGNRTNVSTTQAGSPGAISLVNTSASYPEAQGTVTVTIRRSGGTSGAVSATVALGFTGSATSADASVSPSSVSWISGDSTDKSVTVTIVNDTTLESNETFTVNLSSPQGTSSITFTIVDNDSVETTPPTTPTNLSTSAVSGSQINLSWTASTDASGIAGYRVERCAGSGCSTFSQVGTPTGTSFNDTGLSEITPYSYRVRAVDGVGNFSSYSTTSSATTRDVTGPSAPGSFTATAISATRVDLAWTSSADNTGVSQYRIQRCTGASCSSFSQIGTAVAGATSYSDLTTAQLNSYSYRVYAVDAVPNQGAYSAVASASTPDGTAPSVPSGLSASVVSPNQINISWSASTDNVGVTGYKVYRNGSPVTIATGTSYSDNVLQPSTLYTYQVSAIDAANNESGLSGSASGTTQPLPDTTPPSAPAGLAWSSPSSNQVNLTWGASTDTGGSGLAGYRVYRNGTDIGFAATGITPSFTDTGVVGTTTYSYYVRAIDNANNQSGQSNTVNATTPDTIAPSAPTGLTATVINASRIDVSWSAAADQGGSGIGAYRVYRNGVQIAYLFFGELSLSDTSTQAGTTYTYTVTARDTSGNESPQSSPVSATTPNILGATLSSTTWNYLSVFGQSPQIDPHVVVTASGGSGTGYTYLWEKLSGDANTTASAPSSNSTRWNRSLGTTSAVFTSVWRCRVADSAGTIFYTGNVTVTFERENGD